jgi:hypothetical protein
VDVVLDTALNEALTQLQLPLLVASFIFLAFARSSAAERFCWKQYELPNAY